MASWSVRDVWIVVPNEDQQWPVRSFDIQKDAEDYHRQLNFRAVMRKGEHVRKKFNV